jgi:poly-gamma-glutamate synthesis protein (capsule biosynthesis protein)
MKRAIPALFVAGLAILAAGILAQQARQDDEAAARSFTLALTGDSIITRRLSVHREPAFLGLVELIKGADAAFTNCEMLFHDYEPYPMHESGGTYMRAEPALARELAWAGFDLVSLANNHTGDYGALGMQLTRKHVAEAGLVGAGVGDSLPEAREARFFDTSNGRVALVAVASTFPDHSRASRSRGDMSARPGLSPLRFSRTYAVSRERLESIRATMRELGLGPPAEGETLQFLQNRFVVGTPPGIRTEPLAEDVAEIAAVVRNASRLADHTVVTIHAHEGGASRSVPAQFLIGFAHAMIDAGADVLVGHGPHVLRGIEIYRGKPILYSLGDFIFQNETVLRYPQENYESQKLGPEALGADFNDARFDGDRRGFPADREIWESAVAMLRFRGSEPVTLELHPISLGFGKPRLERGRPMPADPGLARKILDDLARLSRPFGTTVTTKDGIGYLDLKAARASQ